jgi:hypothetical protein
MYDVIGSIIGLGLIGALCLPIALIFYLIFKL